MYKEIIAVLIAYLIGAIPFGLLVAKVLCGQDVRQSGSGNIGATNVVRTAGKKAGIITLAFDILKGLLPTMAAAMLFNSDWITAIVGLSTIIGHIYPVYIPVFSVA